MYRFAARITPEGLAAVAQWLYIEMLKAGYTSVCEFHYVHHAPDGSRYANHAELAQRVVDAASASGIGMTMLPVLYQYSGFGARAPREDQQRFINTPESLLDLLGTVRAAQPESAALRYGVAPHSLRAVSADSLRALARAASMRSARRCTSISPSRPPKSTLASKREGARPVQWLLDRFDVEQPLVPRARHARRCERNARARKKRRGRGSVPDHRSESRRRHFPGACVSRRARTLRGRLG